MPNITLIRDHLFEAIGKKYTEKEFDELCFEFGVEVDDVATEVIEFTGDGSKAEHVVYVIAIPANRYDLLCLEGFARAIRVFLNKESAPVYRALKSAQPNLVMTVEPSTYPLRPYVACAVLRNIKFDVTRYKNFIDLQEKLHQNICRKRTYVAIGTHDLDTLQPPFRYTALPPQDIKFIPLTETEGKEYNGKELLTFYREDTSVKHLKPYTDIIYDSPVYPVIFDSQQTVLSLPPIINSRHSRIQLHTQNVFIECTGTDLTKVNIVLDTMVTMFAEYCDTPFTAESVEIIYPTNPTTVEVTHQMTPLLSHRTCDATVKEINGTLGLSLTPSEMITLCDRMQLGPATYLPEVDSIQVQVPPTRSDILHPVDIIEDVAIAYGFNNIPISIPMTVTSGAPLPINHFTDLLRMEIANSGYMEMLTHGLCSTNENFTYLQRPITNAVSLSNPANIEYEVVRTTLIPGALKTLAYNKSLSHKEGIKLFEISDVVLPDTSHPIGARNERHLVALCAAYSSSFEIIHGLADKIMTAAQIPPEESYGLTSLTVEELADRKRVARVNKGVYFVRTTEDPLYFQGFGAEIVLREEVGEEKVVGTLGVVHPNVLTHFEVSYPCTLMELNLELLM